MMTARVGSRLLWGARRKGSSQSHQDLRHLPPDRALPIVVNLLVCEKNGVQAMAQQYLIEAIGRLERAVSRLEQTPLPQNAVSDPELEQRYAALKSATEEAVAEIDRLLAREGA